MIVLYNIKKKVNTKTKRTLYEIFILGKKSKNLRFHERTPILNIGTITSPHVQGSSY